MHSIFAAVLALAAVGGVHAHYELTRPLPRGVGDDQDKAPCGGYDQVQSPRVAFSSLNNSVDVQLYWNGNVEVFIAVGSNPTKFLYKIGEQLDAKMNKRYTIPIDISKVPGITNNAEATLQTVCHFSPTVDLFQCADLVMDINKPTVASTTTTVATTTTTVAVVDTQPSNIPSVQALQSATNSLVSFIDTREGCMASRLHLKEDEPSRNLAALWLRAAFHDAGTFDPSNAAAPGGADGSLAKMLDDPLHKGIKASIARNFLINPKSKISDADLIAMAGIVTVTHCGGPEIPFKAGREDAVVPVSPKGRLPDDLDGYASIKAAMRRMGFTNEDMVALVVGGHSLGGAHAGISPHVTSEPFVPFDSTPGIFDNDIFKQLLAGNCRLNVDCGIANDPELRPLVEKYAADQAAFFAQFAASYGKMTGFTRSQIMKEHVKLIIPLHKNLVQEGTVNVTFPSKTTTTAAVVSKATSTAVVAPLVSTAVSVSATVEPSASAVPPVIHASESHAPSPVPTGNTGYGYTGDSNGKTDDHDHDHKGKNTDGYADSPILSHASSSVSGIMLTAVSAVLSVAALFMA